MERHVLIEPTSGSCGLMSPNHAFMASFLYLISVMPSSAHSAVQYSPPREVVGGGIEGFGSGWAEESSVSLQEWIDHKLSWNPEEYGGITAIRVPSESLWLPDIVLFEK